MCASNTNKTSLLIPHFRKLYINGIINLMQSQAKTNFETLCGLRIHPPDWQTRIIGMLLLYPHVQFPPSIPPYSVSRRQTFPFVINK